MQSTAGSQKGRRISVQSQVHRTHRFIRTVWLLCRHGHCAPSWLSALHSLTSLQASRDRRQQPSEVGRGAGGAAGLALLPRRLPPAAAAAPPSCGACASERAAALLACRRPSPPPQRLLDEQALPSLRPPPIRPAQAPSPGPAGRMAPSQQRRGAAGGGQQQRKITLAVVSLQLALACCCSMLQAAGLCARPRRPSLNTCY